MISPAALHDALVSLADPALEGQIAADALRAVPGFHDGVAISLERRLGRPPWTVSALESILLSVIGSNEVKACSGEAEIQECHAQPNDWRTDDLHKFEFDLDQALRSEALFVNAASATAIDPSTEPESERDVGDIEAEQNEGMVVALKQSILRVVVKPLLGSDISQEEDHALTHDLLVQLPSIVEQLTTLLKKQTRLANVRKQQLRKASAELSAMRLEAGLLRERVAREEKGRLQAETEAGQGEQARDLLESTISRLTATRKQVKEHEWELLQSRNKVEQLEDDRLCQERKLRELETALSRALAHCDDNIRKSEEQRCEADMEAAQQRGELRRRLSAAELSLDTMTEEVRQCEVKLEEERRRAATNREDFERRLAESSTTIEDLESRLSLALRSHKPQSEVEGCQHIPDTSMACQEEPLAGPDSTVEHHDIFTARESNCASVTGAVASKPAAPSELPRRRHSHAGGERGSRGSRRPSQGGVRGPSQGTVPMNVHALGQLLSGQRSNEHAGTNVSLRADSGARRGPKSSVPQNMQALGQLLAGVPLWGGGDGHTRAQ